MPGKVALGSTLRGVLYLLRWHPQTNQLDYAQVSSANTFAPLCQAGELFLIVSVGTRVLYFDIGGYLRLPRNEIALEI